MANNIIRIFLTFIMIIMNAFYGTHIPWWVIVVFYLFSGTRVTFEKSSSVDKESPFNNSGYDAYKKRRASLKEEKRKYLADYPNASSVPRPDIEEEYLMFSEFIQSIFIKDDSYVIDTGNWRDVNWALIDIIENMIKENPRTWVKNFMY